jgi:hypothetical protein
MRKTIYSKESRALAKWLRQQRVESGSDTTAVSSVASGCDLLEHVKTQLPYALFTGGLSVIAYLIAGWLWI